MVVFCQQCGASHDADAKSCPKCGRPLGTASSETPPTPPTPATPVAPSRGISVRLVVIIGLLVVAVIGAWQLGLFGRLTSTEGAAGDTPPSGEIWFGSSFDPTTFALSGITTTLKTGEAAALLAQLPRSVSEGDMSVRVSLDGTVIASEPIAMEGSGELFGVALTPFDVAGSYKYDFVDIGGNLLASGSLTVTGTMAYGTMDYWTGQIGRGLLYAGIPIIIVVGAIYAQRRRRRPFSNAMWVVIGVGAFVLATLVAGLVF